MDKSWWVSAAFGGALIIGGVLMLRSHLRTWNRQQADPELDDEDRHFLQRRFRRRMQASGLLTLIGVMLPLGDVVRLFAGSPWWFAVYWIVVLILVMWLFVLALGDMALTKVHTTVALNRIRAEQRKLEKEAAALRAQMSNGHDQSNGAAPRTEPEP